MKKVFWLESIHMITPDHLICSQKHTKTTVELPSNTSVIEYSVGKPVVTWPLNYFAYKQ
jgi:hypothetical protein